MHEVNAFTPFTVQHGVGPTTNLLVTGWRANNDIPLGMYRILLLTSVANFTIASVELKTHGDWNGFCKYDTVSLLNDYMYSFGNKQNNLDIYTARTKIPTSSTVKFAVRSKSGTYKGTDVDIPGSWQFRYGFGEIDPVAGCPEWSP